MTLLLATSTSSAIHICSDYRLTDVRTKRPFEDVAGTKQVRVARRHWSADIAFTGVAQIGHVKTREWIIGAVTTLPDDDPASSLISELAKRATAALLTIPRTIRHLTILLNIWESPSSLRLFVISNFNLPNRAPLITPVDHLVVYELSEKPRCYMFGLTTCVSREDRKLFRQLARKSGKLHWKEIHKSLSEVNLRSSGRSGDFVSGACMVSSIFVDGANVSENFGRVAGAPAQLVGRWDLQETISRSLPEAKNKQPIFVRGVGLRSVGKQTSWNTDVEAGQTMAVYGLDRDPDGYVTDSFGHTFTRMSADFDSAMTTQPEAQRQSDISETREVKIFSPSASRWIGDPGWPGEAKSAARILVSAVETTARLKKDLEVFVTLNVVTFEMNPNLAYAGPLVETVVTLDCLPTIDGVTPISWTYSIEVRVDAGRCALAIRQNSVALRPENHKTPMTSVKNGEELVLVAPCRPLIIEVSKGKKAIVSASIKAKCLIRDAVAPTGTLLQQQTSSLSSEKPQRLP